MKDIWIIISIFILSIIIGLVLRAFLNYQDEKEENENKEKTKDNKNEINLTSEILVDNGKYGTKRLLEKFEKKDDILSIPIGWDKKDNIIDINLKNNLLVIGTTGSGKSICLNEIITSIVMNYSSTEIKLLTIDTSMVELSSFNSIPYYIKNTIVSPTEIVEELQELAKEITRRRKNNKNTPILVLIDDFYDVCSFDQSILPTIERLLKEGKDKNVYFIIATDTPSTEIITEDIKNEIDGTIYLTLAPGEKQEFSLDLTKTDIEYITEIGNAIYKTNDNKEKIKIPEVTDDEIKLIRDSFLH